MDTDEDLLLPLVDAEADETRGVDDLLAAFDADLEAAGKLD